MTSTVIVRTDSKLKAKAQKVAGDLGLTLTSVINNYLEDFVEKKSASFGETKKKYKDPYGMFAGEEISEKEIKNITNDWMKTIDEIV